MKNPTDKPRYFKVDAGQTLTVVATDPSHAWRLVGEFIETTEAGDDLLGDSVTMTEMEPAAVDRYRVHDENGPTGTESPYPLRRAEIGAVFSSEW